MAADISTGTVVPSWRTRRILGGLAITPASVEVRQIFRRSVLIVLGHEFIDASADQFGTDSGMPSSRHV